MYTKHQLTGFDKDQLKRILKANNVKGLSKLNKDGLSALIIEKQNSNPEFICPLRAPKTMDEILKERRERLSSL